jgi:hypothetical protein
MEARKLGWSFTLQSYTRRTIAVREQWIQEIISSGAECQWLDDKTLYLPQRNLKIHFANRTLQECEMMPAAKATLQMELKNLLRLIEVREYRDKTISFSASNTWSTT